MYKKGRFTFRQRKDRAARIGAVKALDSRRRRLYNLKYRKSFFFISAWFIRLIYISLFIVAVLLNNSESVRKEKEIVLSSTISTIEGGSIFGSRTRNMTFTVYEFKTNKESYSIDIYSVGAPNIEIGDTILIERNLLGKAVFVSKPIWKNKFLIRLNIIPYFLIFFVSLISCFFNDGLERFTSPLLYSCIILDAIALFCYFFAN